MSFLHIPGDGCGHTKLGPESGTLTSANYPGTYPQEGSCTWRLHVPQGRTLRLLFGDFDIEGSMDCPNGSLVITPSNGSPSIGKHTHSHGAPRRDKLTHTQTHTHGALSRGKLTALIIVVVICIRVLVYPKYFNSLNHYDDSTK